MRHRNFIVGLILILVLAVVYYQHPRFNLTQIRAGPTDRQWNVLDNYKNKREAAELLAKVNSTMIEFMRVLKKKYHIDEPDDIIAAEGVSHSKILNAPGDVYNIVDNLLNNYNPEVFYENDPRKSDNTSYTVNKGSSMYVCLRDKSNITQLTDFDTLLFVMLHEASHIANYRGWGHGIDFWQTFLFILHEAQLAGIYKPIDYSKYPVDYCGLRIEYNPIFDKTLKRIWKE